MNTSQNNSAQNSEQTNPKTINDLHTEFAELCFSYGLACQGESGGYLGLMQLHCEELAAIAGELKAQIVGGAQ
ncbi:MAG: hypothetical protein ACXWTU_03830 [Methylotenera sp.]